MKYDDSYWISCVISLLAIVSEVLSSIYMFFKFSSTHRIHYTVILIAKIYFNKEQKCITMFLILNSIRKSLKESVKTSYSFSFQFQKLSHLCCVEETMFDIQNSEGFVFHSRLHRGILCFGKVRNRIGEEC